MASDDPSAPFVRLVPREPNLFAERRLTVRERASIGRAVGKVKPMVTNGIFDSKVLSRAHAEVWFEDGKFMLKDVKSSNGTFLNSNRLSDTGQESRPFEIKCEDVVQFGVDVLENNKVTHRCIIATLICCDPTDPESVALAVLADARAHAMLVSGGSNSAPGSASATMVGAGGSGSAGAAGGEEGATNNADAAAAATPSYLAALGSAGSLDNNKSGADSVQRSMTMTDGASLLSAAGVTAAATTAAPSAAVTAAAKQLAHELPAALEQASGDAVAIASILTQSTMGSMNAATAAAVAAAVAAAQAPKPGIVHLRDETIAQLTAQLVAASSREHQLATKLEQLEQIVASIEQTSAMEYEIYFEEEKLMTRIDTLERQLSFYQHRAAHVAGIADNASPEAELLAKVADLSGSLVNVEQDRHSFEFSAKEMIRKAIEDKQEVDRRCLDLERALAAHKADHTRAIDELKEAKVQTQAARLEEDRLKVLLEQGELQIAHLRTEVEELRLSTSAGSEAKRKVTELTEQLEKAEKFRVEFMTLQEQWSTQDSQRQEEITQLRKSLEEVTAQRDGAKQMANSLKVSLAASLAPSPTVNANSAELEASKARIVELSAQLQTATDALKTETAKTSELVSKTEELTAQVTASVAAAAAFEAKISTAENERKGLVDANQQLRSLTAQLASVQEEAAALSHATERNYELVATCDRLVGEMTSLRSERDRLAEQLQALANDSSSEAHALRDQIAAKEAELDKVHKSSEETAKELSAARTRLEKKESSTREELQAIGAKLAAITAERDEMNGKLAELRKTINSRSKPLIITSAGVVLLAAIVALQQMH
ncbi:hypothetical protein CAOG_07007 [Capsaspora owczarzaki ATCC 30864]|uniref:FHA domain-containing protein n=1 Tax=Capsaspora owczarzaki (strain ATCC 30864) TaxID=595528 RepID=A0A0D2VYD6_CAPO3|nr:hypothetical protein CAOG_07007 [Capsaspora owczarzaki ATCC 30864]KJE96732.1 hypothetical protein CAOG_007007 [Capsaspora owczarzaki ATCC 30864]|eukprot:XP_004343731.2 hypothetical protein CAOG_07007 [Capsaspora owczarzaki ATCC 30864]